MQLSDRRISLGRAVWGPAGNQNALLAGYAAGPAQVQIGVVRDGLNPAISDAALQQEGFDLAAMLEEKTGHPPIHGSAGNRFHAPPPSRSGNCRLHVLSNGMIGTGQRNCVPRQNPRI